MCTNKGSIITLARILYNASTIYKLEDSSFSLVANKERVKILAATMHLIRSYKEAIIVYENIPEYFRPQISFVRNVTVF